MPIDTCRAYATLEHTTRQLDFYCREVLFCYFKLTFLNKKFIIKNVNIGLSSTVINTTWHLRQDMHARERRDSIFLFILLDLYFSQSIGHSIINLSSSPKSKVIKTRDWPTDGSCISPKFYSTNWSTCVVRWLLIIAL